MNCKIATRHFSEFFDGRLEAAIADQLDDHLNECESCSGAYAAYDRLFGALRSVPPTRTSRPVPLPESAHAFAPPRRVSAFSRAVSAAAVFLLVGISAKFGYEYGTRGNVRLGSEVGGGDTIQAAVLPTQAAGQRLRRMHDSTANLALMVNDARKLADQDRAADALSGILSVAPIDHDAASLGAMGRADLGTYESDIHEFSNDVSGMARELKRRLQTGAAPGRARLDAASRFLGNSLVGQRMTRLSSVARRYDPEPYSPAWEYGVEHANGGFDGPDVNFFRGSAYALSGQYERGVELLNRYSSENPQSPLRSLFYAMVVRVGLPRQFRDGIAVPREVADLLLSHDAINEVFLKSLNVSRDVMCVEVRMKNNAAGESETFVVMRPSEPAAGAPAPAPVRKKSITLRGGSTTKSKL